MVQCKFTMLQQQMRIKSCRAALNQGSSISPLSARQRLWCSSRSVALGLQEAAFPTPGLGLYTVNLRYWWISGPHPTAFSSPCHWVGVVLPWMAQGLLHRSLLTLRAWTYSCAKVSDIQRQHSGILITDGGSKSKTIVIVSLYEARTVFKPCGVWKFECLFLTAENNYCHVNAILCTPPTKTHGFMCHYRPLGNG